MGYAVKTDLGDQGSTQLLPGFRTSCPVVSLETWAALCCVLGDSELPDHLDYSSDDKITSC